MIVTHERGTRPPIILPLKTFFQKKDMANVRKLLKELARANREAMADMKEKGIDLERRP